MKTIGLLGGTAWVSTIEYYRYLNQEVNKKLGKHHSAKIVLNSIDYEQIKKFNYENWEKIEDILMEEIPKLENCGVDCILICNNTLHKAYEKIAPNLYIETPVFHIADCVGEYANKQGVKTVLLLGTKFTMENGFYAKKLENFGLNVITPTEIERNEIQRISQEELSKEVFTDKSKEWFRKLVEQSKCDGVVLACTELSLLIKQEDYNLQILDSLKLHCDKAINFVLT